MRTAIFHIGLPKTGTTSLQVWCDERRAELLDFGIDYPDYESDGLLRHQFVVTALKCNNLSKVERLLLESSSPTIVFSTEGLSNQFFGFDEAALAELRRTLRSHRVIVFVTHRNKSQWIRSYYKQCVLNPPGGQGSLNANTLCLEDFSKLDRVQALFALPLRPHVIRAAFGAREVVVAKFEEDWFEQFLEVCGARALRSHRLKRHHTSLEDGIVEIIRQINGLGLSSADRTEMLTVLFKFLAVDNHTIRRFYANGSDRGVELVRRYASEIRPVCKESAAIVKAWRQNVSGAEE